MRLSVQAVCRPVVSGASELARTCTQRRVQLRLDGIVRAYFISTTFDSVEKDEPAKLKFLLDDCSESSATQRYGPQLLAKCLFISASRGRLECVRQLLAAGAPPDVRGDNNGNTPLIVATRRGDPEVVSALIAAGCDVNKPSNVARSRALHWASSSVDTAGSVECLRLLLKAGVDVEARVASGRTALMLAARAGHDEAVKELIKQGVNVNSADNDRNTALHLAAQEDCVDCVRRLIQTGSDVTAENRHKETPLTLAAKHGHQDVVKLLLELSEKSFDPLTSASAGRSRPVRGYFGSRKRQSMSPVHWAAAGGHHRCVALLMTSKTWRQLADTPTTEQCEAGDFVAAAGTTPLMLAAKSGSCDVIRELTSATPDLLVDRQDADGMTALLHAISSDHYHCVELLLLTGACQDGVASTLLSDPTSPDQPTTTTSTHRSFHLSPVVLSIASGAVTSLRVLLQAGCRLDLSGRPNCHGDDVLPLDIVGDLSCPESVACQRQVLTTMDLLDVAVRNRSFECDDHMTSSTFCQQDSSSASFNLQPTTLSGACRRLIRRHLLDVDELQGHVVVGGLFASVLLLPLPTALRRYLLLAELGPLSFIS